jgi:hypothetical protein
VNTSVEIQGSSFECKDITVAMTFQKADLEVNGEKTAHVRVSPTEL